MSEIGVGSLTRWLQKDQRQAQNVVAQKFDTPGSCSALLSMHVMTLVTIAVSILFAALISDITICHKRFKRAQRSGGPASRRPQPQLLPISRS